MKNILMAVIALLTVSFKINKTSEIKTVRIDKSKSSITYTMTHPVHTWEGTCKEVDGVVQYDAKTSKIIKVAALAKIASFNSKNSNRDSHMLEVTDAIKYPSVSFVSTSVKDDGSTLDVTGKVTFHNVTKEIHFVATSKPEDNRRVLTGDFILLLEDFNIERPSFMLVKTENKMKIDFNIGYAINA